MRHHLTPLDESIWRNFLNTISLGTNKILPTPLGKWREIPIADWLDSWDFFLTEDKQFLYHEQTDNKWHRYLQKTNSHRTYYIPYMELNEIPEEDLDRVSIKKYANSISVVSTSKKTIAATP